MPSRPSVLSLAARAKLRSFAQLLVVALAPFAASCTGASEVCSPSDPLCSSGTPTAPVFPTIAQSVLDALCIRGEAVPTTSKSGTVDSTDCLFAIGDGYFEGWRVRVGAASSVTFEVTSNLDTVLEVYRVENLSDVVNSAVLIGDDDDSGVDFNARLVASLVEGTEYLVLIGGYDDFEQGPYTLNMTAS